MSLRNKFENIKQVVEEEKEVSQFEKIKNDIGGVDSEKKSVASRIDGLKNLLSELENAYASASGSLNEFKASKDKINNLFSEYEEYLKERGINSVEDILSDEDFSQENEIKDYRNKGIGNLEERGKLGQEVESLAKTKDQVKEAFPSLELDFKGKKPEGGGASPRQESIQKIRNYIKELEQSELVPVVQKETEIKEEYLLKIKEIIAKNLDNEFKENFSPNNRSSNVNFINQEIFEICGDKFWPETKQIARELIEKAYNKKGIHFSDRDIDKSLESEKLIFDAEDLKKKHSELLSLERDREHYVWLENEIVHGAYINSGGEFTFKEGKICRADILKHAEEFNAKNPEAKIICEEVKSELLSFFTTAEAMVSPGLLTRKNNKQAMEEFKEIMKNSIEKLNNLQIPDNFFTGKNRNQFYNELYNACPHLSRDYDYDWYRSLRPQIEEITKQQVHRIDELVSSENNTEFSNTVHRVKDWGDRGGNMAIGGFDLPAISLKNARGYKEIVDKESVDNLFKLFEGKTLTKEELSELLEQGEKMFADRVKAHPNSEEIIDRYNKLLKKYDNDLMSYHDVVDYKMRSRGKSGNLGYPRDGALVRKELFGA